MSKPNNIGLDVEKSGELAVLLNDLLANYSVLYQNTRGYHWNIKGSDFFELHEKFEELYNDLLEKIDDIAERVLTLGHVPEHKFSAYLLGTEIEESNEVSNGKKAIEEITEALQKILIKERHILDLAGAIGDEGSVALMSDYIREQEKLMWMYSAYLNQ